MMIEFTNSKLPTLPVQEGLSWYGWLVLPLHLTEVQILKCSHTVCLYKLCTNSNVWKNCAHFPPLSFFIHCFKNKFHIFHRTEADCRKQITTEWGNWKQLNFLFAIEWVLHMNVVLRLLSNKQWYKYSILFLTDPTLPLCPLFSQPRFYFGFRSDWVFEILG